MCHTVSYRILGDYGGEVKRINLVSFRHLLETKLKLKKKTLDLNLDLRGLKVSVYSHCKKPNYMNKDNNMKMV